MSTNDSDIWGQLLAPRQELGALNNSLLNPRRDDPRRVFSRQMKSVMMERVDEFFYSINKTRRMNGPVKAIGLNWRVLWNGSPSCSKALEGSGHHKR